MSVPAVTAEDFRASVLESPEPVLVDFGAPWCAPCRKLEPIVAQIADEHGGRLRVVSVDIDRNPGVASEYAVLSVPTLVLFLGGAPVCRVVGLKKKDAILSALDPHLAT